MLDWAKLLLIVVIVWCWIWKVLFHGVDRRKCGFSGVITLRWSIIELGKPRSPVRRSAIARWRNSGDPLLTFTCSRWQAMSPTSATVICSPRFTRSAKLAAHTQNYASDLFHLPLYRRRWGLNPSSSTPLRQSVKVWICLVVKTSDSFLPQCHSW